MKLYAKKMAVMSIPHCEIHNGLMKTKDMIDDLTEYNKVHATTTEELLLPITVGTQLYY